jgi:adenine-specific DNA-methyltransferase
MATQVTAQKLAGAFYTSPAIAEILVNWAVRSRKDLVLDPACGEGIFLRIARNRLDEIGGNGKAQAFGIELDPAAFSISASLVSSGRVVHSDFFDVDETTLPKVTAVLGNPPFIRYQSFKGSQRAKGVAISRELGVLLPELASSWAPFVVSATRFLIPSGRLALVVPAEIQHASYAREVVKFLTRSFRKVYLAAFVHRLFPEISQDTMLLFADDYGGACSELLVKTFSTASDLSHRIDHSFKGARRISASDVQGNGRLRQHLLPRECEGLYKDLEGWPMIARMGEIGRVGIGYVTGCNDYFHLSEREVTESGIPEEFLKRAVSSHQFLKGLKFGLSEWNDLRRRGEKVYLLSLPNNPERKLSSELRSYLAKGKRKNVHNAYKCRVRKPWFKVPHNGPSDAFISYMIGDRAVFATNLAKALATNSTHEFRLNPLNQINALQLAASFATTLTQLSCEIEGHPMGGGLLKMEPREAERAFVVLATKELFDREAILDIDKLFRRKSEAAQHLVDEAVLIKSAGMSRTDVEKLRRALVQLREARRKKIAQKTQ